MCRRSFGGFQLFLFSIYNEAGEPAFQERQMPPSRKKNGTEMSVMSAMSAMSAMSVDLDRVLCFGTQRKIEYIHMYLLNRYIGKEEYEFSTILKCRRYGREILPATDGTAHTPR